jgi:hypothetical protein
LSLSVNVTALAPALRAQPSGILMLTWPPGGVYGT